MHQNNSTIAILFGGSEAEVLARFVNQFPELAWLTGDVSASPEANSSQAGSSFGQQLFPKIPKEKLTEFDRTAVGILVLKWVFENNYTRFVECQPPHKKLTLSNFKHLRNFALRVLPNAEAAHAMVCFMVINDLTKIHTIVDQLHKELALEEVDHDVLLYEALRLQPDLSPSYAALPICYQQLIIEGLGAKFNIGQFMQGENVAASLLGVKNLSAHALDFYLLHALCDIGGAGGQFAQNGSLVLQQTTFENFKMSIEALEKLKTETALDQVYNHFLALKANSWATHINTETQKAIVRLACMFRVETKTEFDTLALHFATYKNSNLLQNELNQTGLGSSYATLIYYAPALLHNLKKAAGMRKAISLGLEVLSQVYSAARKTMQQRTKTGVYTIVINQLAKQASTKPETIVNQNWYLEKVGDNAVLRIQQL